MAPPPRTRRKPHDDGLEPITESLVKLLLWLHGPPRRTGATLARACGYSQQRISQVLCRKSRPEPGSELAELIHLATAGRVPVEGWLIPSEVREREARRQQAAEHGHLIASGEVKEAPNGRQHVPSLGRLGARLGLETQDHRRVRVTKPVRKAKVPVQVIAPPRALEDRAEEPSSEGERKA